MFHHLIKQLHNHQKSFTLTPLDNSASQNRFIRFFKKNLINLSNGVNRTKSFTLIELLIVIAILALLMSIIIITLNPSELLKQTRDTKRISNLKSINNALSIFQATKPTTSMGTANIVYISIPDSSSTCANLSLPTLPTGYTYQCSTTDNYKKTDGTGWIPVNFDSLDIGSPLSSLPIDPTNTTSTNLFYTYTTGGSWELNAILESSKQKLSGGDDKTSVDGGDSYSTYEIGTDLSLSPYKDTGLVGYWKFDDASGTTAVDSSGYNNTGTLTNGPLWKTQTDCKRGGCLYFDGVNDFVDCASSTSVNITGALSLSAWINFGDVSKENKIIGKGGGLGQDGSYNLTLYSGNHLMYLDLLDSALNRDLLLSTTLFTNNGVWYYIVATWDGTTNDSSMKIYVNGNLENQGTATISSLINAYSLGIGGPSYALEGYIDDVRVYNRALSASEIKAIYEGTK